jgi:hypothetical protein
MRHSHTKQVYCLTAIATHKSITWVKDYTPYHARLPLVTLDLFSISKQIMTGQDGVLAFTVEIKFAAIFKRDNEKHGCKSFQFQTSQKPGP